MVDFAKALKESRIKVMNKHTHDCKECVYIGAHELTLAQFKTKTRDEAVDKYLPWLREQYKNKEDVRVLLNSLAERYNEGEEIHLQCWCAPQRCHGDVIKQAIIKIAEKIKEK